MPTISEQIHAAGQGIAQADETTLTGLLNDTIRPFIAPAFKIITGHVSDRDGLRTADFASVIYTTFDQPDNYPLQQATEIAVASAKKCLSQHEALNITFVCFDDAAYGVYKNILEAEENGAVRKSLGR